MEMASAHNLLGVVSQLQSMENTLTAILIETALKLSSLTDAKVFVLVDSSEGRRVAGAPQLCHTYATNGLTPTGSDIEIVLEPNVKTIREQPLFPTELPKSRTPSNVGHDGYQTLHTPRHSDAEDDVRSVSTSSHYDNHNIRPHHHNQLHHSPISQRKRPSQNSIHHVDKVPRLNDYVNESTGGNEDESAISHYDQSYSNDIHERQNESGIAEHSTMDDSYRFNQDYEQDYEVNVSYVDDFLHDNQKADRVREILDDSAADKSSVNHKLTMSLLYDFAKCIWTNCPYQDYKTPAFRSFFESSFQKFWDSFPNFMIWEENSVKFQVGIDKKTELALMKPPKSFIRKYVRNGVSDLKIKKSGRRRTTGSRANSQQAPVLAIAAPPCNYPLSYPNQ